MVKDVLVPTKRQLSWLYQYSNKDQIPYFFFCQLLKVSVEVSNSCQFVSFSFHFYQLCSTPFKEHLQGPHMFKTVVLSWIIYPSIIKKWWLHNLWFPLLLYLSPSSSDMGDLGQCGFHYFGKWCSRIPTAHIDSLIINFPVFLCLQLLCSSAVTTHAIPQKAAQPSPQLWCSQSWERSFESSGPSWWSRGGGHSQAGWGESMVGSCKRLACG